MLMSLKSLRALGLCVLFALGCSADNSQDADDDEREELRVIEAPGANASDTAGGGARYRFRRDSRSVPRKLSIEEPPRLAAALRLAPVNATEIAREFLKTNADLLSIPASLTDLLLDSASGGQVDFVQMLAGRPVLGAGVRLDVDAEGRVALVYNQHVSGLGTPPSTPTISCDEALAIARAWGVEASTCQRAWAFDATERLVSALALEGAGTSMVLEASTGEVLWRDEDVRDVLGRGSGYSENSWVDPRPIALALRELAADGTLRGPHVQVLAPPASAANARATRYVFDYPPGTPQFGQVMVYHHLDSVTRWLERLGYPARTEPILVHVRALAELNAYFDPARDAIFLGANQAFDTATDADVVVHEYGHAVVQAYAPHLLGPGFPRSLDGAIHEGYGDYLSCAYFENALSSESLHLALARAGGAAPYLKKIGFEARRPGRRCDSARSWPSASDPDPHVTGMIVSGTLWELRIVLSRSSGAGPGARVADRLALGALSHLARSGNDLTDLLDAVLETDRRQGGGNAAVIRAAFAKHGIRPGAPVVLGHRPPWLP